MKWQGRERSAHVEDRRGAAIARRGAPIGLVIVAGLVVWALGGDPSSVLGLLGDQPAAPTARAPAPRQDEMTAFVSVILRDTEVTWQQLFRQAGRTYEEPKLVLFSSRVESACGFQSAATGPFYCPADKKAYIDLSFYDELARRFGAPGDFAQAYVLAHEVGHHVQNLLGTSTRVHRQKRTLPKEQANQLSVRLELQADCYAGVWAHHARAQRDMLERGDVEEGLRAAAAIGDDTLQKKAQGYTVPESWTHGSSTQRVEWLKRGMASGRLEDCDTFAAR